MQQKYTFAFWGTGPLAESTIYALYKNGLIPKYIITKPDTKIGREQILTAPMIKTWGLSKNIKVIQPTSLKIDDNINLSKSNNNIKTEENITTIEQDIISDNQEFKNFINDNEIDFHILASYGKILPAYIFEKAKIINVHPSDLPDLRGPSPLQSALLRGDKKITITLMEMDKEMDHGNIIIKNNINIEEGDTLETLLRKSGNLAGQTLCEILDFYLSGNIRTTVQDHNKATFCKFINKEDGDITNIIVKDTKYHTIDNTNQYTEEIDLNINTDKLEKIKNMYRALTPWPGIFFFINSNNTKNNLENIKDNLIIQNTDTITKEDNIKKIRIKITDFDLTGQDIVSCIKKVIPEGKKEIDFEKFLQNYK